MIKLRHQQPSQWHRSLAEDIGGLWEPWMRRVGRRLETSNSWTGCMKRRGNAIPRAAFVAACKPPQTVAARPRLNAKRCGFQSFKGRDSRSSKILFTQKIKFGGKKLRASGQRGP
jgi:hypothetical protein